MSKLRDAAQRVVNSWEGGNLAEAVNELQKALATEAENIEVRPMVYEKHAYPYSVRAEKAGDKEGNTTLFGELSVLIFDERTGKCVSDTYFMIDRESGEPKILLTMDGDGDGDKKLAILPIRSVTEGIRESNEG
jgi:hypothetical protein